MAVRCRPEWFYVPGEHGMSRSTLALLHIPLALQAGEAKAVQPVLTIPVGRR